MGLVLTTCRLAGALFGGALALTSGAAAQERLPDGGVAVAAGGGAVRAWYGRPTGRYAHGVLGDAVEGGSLVVLDEAGRRHELVLPERYVFEDITPRIADLDGDRRNEIVTIRTDASAGAAVAVYDISGGQLVERAATDPIGRPNRWLSIAGIASFTNPSTREIAVVKTPHIGGVLELLALRGDRLVSLYAPVRGYTSHVIGSRILSLAGIGDLTGDGISELALPDQSLMRIDVLGFVDGVKRLASRDLPAPLGQPVEMEALSRDGIAR